MALKTKKSVAIVGAGPAGLMAADILALAGVDVCIYERKPSIGRKFLMAGRGGLNITHSEPLGEFLKKYGEASDWLTPLIKKFSPDHLRQFCADLGEETFVGSSGRVFPKSMKASPLLRAWRGRLEKNGVQFKLNYDWKGWTSDSGLLFQDLGTGHEWTVKPSATLLALGGGSWQKLGSDGSWVSLLRAKGVDVNNLEPCNCGFVVTWSDVFRGKYAGTPLKSIAVKTATQLIPGEIMITQQGLEGGAVYAISSEVRQEISRNGSGRFWIDLKPAVDENEIADKLSEPRQGATFSNFLKRKLNMSPAAIGLLYEMKGIQHMSPPELARQIKSFEIKTSSAAPIDRAISSSGGVRRDTLTSGMMIEKLPGVFVSGEMIDWDAPTGGYLLQATYATAVAAAEGILKYLNR